MADGHKVAKSAIVLDRPIKAIGVYEVKAALHPEVSVTIKVNGVASRAAGAADFAVLIDQAAWSEATEAERLAAALARLG